MDSATDLTGKIIGKYKVLERLGRGGMAEVYKAYQTSLDRYVALKIILPFFTSDPDFTKRFEREAKNVAALRHPNIVQVFDYDVEGGTPYMVMEFVEGDSLTSLLDKLARHGQQLSYPQAVRLAREIGQALAYAHKQGVVHRDVKPGNVMVDRSGRVILTDFGVAKMIGNQTLTATGAATGTPAYMSPEQALGQAADHRADLYALGVILYELVTGQVPFDADTPLAIMLKHAHEVRPSPRRLRPDLPEGLERVILKSMARDPNERFQSADEMISFLNNPAAAAQVAVPASATTAGDPTALPTFLTGSPSGAPAMPEPPATIAEVAAPAEAAALASQDTARTAGHYLREVACFNCTGAGLELEPDGRARCSFCSEINALAGPVCPRCEFVNAANTDLCAACNLALVRTCPNCDARNWSGAERCVQCGRSLDTLSALIDRAGDAGERYHQERRELAAAAAREAAGARQRLERLEDIDRRRQEAIQQAAARKVREQRLALFAAAILVIVVVVAFTAAMLFLR